jgi:hypothetical protein
VEDQLGGFESSGSWLAAGLWGLLKLSPAADEAAIALLQHHWRGLLQYWTPQQLSDIASAVMVIADEHCHQDVELPGGQQLVELVAGLAAELVVRLQQLELAQLQAEGSEVHIWQQDSASSNLISRVPLPWPATLLPARGQQQVPPKRGLAIGPIEQVVCLVNSSQLSWKMLQALTAVGVDVNQPEQQMVEAVEGLAHFMQQGAE